MDKIYYQPLERTKAVKKLAELSGEKPKVIKQWLSRQAFWQVHLPAPKRVDRPHCQVTVPNEMHQFGLFYMPSDTLYGNKYKYILAGIDAASRYKVARPLRTKQGRDVAEMIADIYKVGHLTYPKIFQCDNGSKFKGEVTKMLEKQEVKIRRVTTKYKHTYTAFVEALNKILAERLFEVQDAQELNDPEKVSSRWVKKEVPLVARESYPPEEVLPEDGLYRYLLQPSEEHDEKRCRATDRIWSKGTYRLREIVENPGNRVMYYLKDGPERAFVSEELMLYSEDTELPPDYVQEW